MYSVALMHQNAKELYTHGLWHRCQAAAIGRASYSPFWVRRSSEVLKLKRVFLQMETDGDPLACIFYTLIYSVHCQSRVATGPKFQQPVWQAKGKGCFINTTQDLLVSNRTDGTHWLRQSTSTTAFRPWLIFCSFIWKSCIGGAN